MISYPHYPALLICIFSTQWLNNTSNDPSNDDNYVDYQEYVSFKLELLLVMVHLIGYIRLIIMQSHKENYLRRFCIQYSAKIADRDIGLMCG